MNLEYKQQQLTEIDARNRTILDAQPKKRTVKRQVAENLSMRNIAQSHAETLNRALLRLVELCYETDDDGYACNVDPANGKILLRMPTGTTGLKDWGLVRMEADVLRAILLHRQHITDPLPLLSYDGYDRRWYLNATRAGYPNIDFAKQYLTKHPITAQDWRTFHKQILTKT